MKARFRFVASLSLSLVVAGCTDPSTAPPEIGEALTPSIDLEVLLPESQRSPGAQTPTSGQSADGPTTQPTSPSTTVSSRGEQPAPSQASSEMGAFAGSLDNRGRVGALGAAIVRNDIPSLTVAIHEQAGVSASAQATSFLESTLNGIVDKPGGLRVVTGESVPSDRTQWTAADLRTTARAVGGSSSELTTHLDVLYVRGGLFVDGQESDAIGVAFEAGSVAIFPDKINDLLLTLLGGATRVEQAVLIHELGHLLGLVDVTFDSPRPREDPERPGHTSNRNSVMYWAIETSAIGQVFTGPVPREFDADDLADIADLRAGRLGP